MAEQAAQAAGGARVAFGQVSKVIVPASASVFPILKAAGASAASLFDLVKLEIFRDFFQIISLFFAGLAERLPSSFRSFWGNVADTFSVCFSCWSRDLQGSTFSIVMFVIVFLLSVCVSIYFMYGYWSRKADDDSSGLEVKKWGSRGRGEHRRAKYSALVLTTLYLPAFRNVVQVFSCDTKYVEPGDSCFAGTHNLLVAMSVLLLLLYLVPIPIIFYSIIQRSKPTVRLYDEEGNLRQGDVKYTDADYRQDLARDKSPYKDLYEPFERKWAYYKVLVLLMKALLVLPAALLVTTNSVGGREVETEDIDSGDKSLLLIQSIVMLIVLSLYTVLSTTTRPFLSDSDDWLDGVSRFCTLVVSLFGLLTYFTGADAAFGAVLNTLVALATLLMIVLFLGNIPAVAAWWQGVRQRIKFTPSRLDATASHVLHDELSLDQERKLRIWHEFWDVLFLQDGTLRVPHDTKNYPPDSDDEAEPEYVPMPLDYQRGHTPPYLINFQGTVGERHDESQQIVASESLAAYESTLAVAVSEEMGGPAGPDGMTATQEMRFLITSLTGVDVYWNGQVDGRPDGDEGQVRTRTLRAPTNGTGFGKLYVVPFPFTAVLTFDQGKDHVIFSSAPVVAGVTRDPLAGKRELEELIRLNQSPEVQAKKELRTSLRAMNGKPVYFYIQKMVTKTERKRVGTDSQGHAKYRTITHHVLMTFQNGNFHIGSAGNAVWTDPLTGEQLDASAGFSCAITYHDGFGTSDKGKHFSNESITIGHGDLGITNDFTLNDTVSRLLNGNPNRGHVAANYSTVLKRMQRYRDHYASQFQHKESVLSYAFWYFVYNFDRITVEELHQVLAMEKNALLNKLAEKYAKELEMVGGKLRYFDTHPSVAMWFSFWHDVWVNNQQLEPIGEHADLFDPFKETAICYRPMPREQLVELLEEHDLHGSPGCGGLFLGFFNDAILDQLYERMDYFSQQPVVENEQARAALSEQHPLLADPVRHYELTSAFFQNLLHDEVVDEGEPELFRRVETFNTADPEPQENPPMQPMQPGPDVAVQQVYGTQQPYGSQPPPYGAPAQQPYGAPVQQQYGAPVQQQYGAPVQQPYGAQPVVVPVQPAARTSPQVHPAPSGVMVPPTIQNLPPSGGGAPIIINANPGQIVVNSKPSSQE